MTDFKSWVLSRAAQIGLDSQQALADEIGISYTTLSKAISGPLKTRKQPAMWIWMARTLLVTVDDLKAAMRGNGRRLASTDLVLWSHQKTAAAVDTAWSDHLPPRLRMKFSYVARRFGSSERCIAAAVESLLAAEDIRENYVLSPPPTHLIEERGG